VWWAEVETMRRPVLVVTRSEAVDVLTGIVVAPVTRTVRGIPTEISLGPEDGLPEQCVAAFDNLQRVSRSALTRRLGDIAPRREAICTALRALADC
jgi:mRNA interferase MazF